MNMIGHLDRAERRALWATLAKRLAQKAPIVLNLQSPDSAIVLPDTRFTEIPIGRRTYEGWGRVEPHGTDAVAWHMRYRVLEDGVPVDERAVDYRWWIVAEDDLRAEAAEFGSPSARSARPLRVRTPWLLKTITMRVSVGSARVGDRLSSMLVMRGKRCS